MSGDRGGRPKKPTALKLLHGDRTDRVNTDEPQPAELLVEPPAWLTDDARELWTGLAPDLIAKHVLTSWDVEAFAAWCDAAARRRRAVAALAAEGEVVESDVFGKNGEKTGTRRVKNPWAYVLTDADAQVQRYASRFGLTPSDRAGLSIGEAPSVPGQDLLTG